MPINVHLPQCLDSIIYDKFKAVYEPRPLDVVSNLYQPYDFVKLYLGTYFPRSFAEAYCIMLKLLQNPRYKAVISQIESINILDFCCGTGGEIFGMICVLCSSFPNLKRINIDAIDGNVDALRYLYHLQEALKTSGNIRVELYITPLCLSVETEQDMADLIKMLNMRYHYILSFKALNEFVQKNTLSNENVYGKITAFLLPLLMSNGSFILSDVTSKHCDKYYPELMNKGINDALRVNPNYKSIIPYSCYYMEAQCVEGCYMQDMFMVSHSRKEKDKTKVAYRILCNKDFADAVMTGTCQSICKVVDYSADKSAPYR